MFRYSAIRTKPALFATCETDISTAVDAVDTAGSIAIQAGYNVKVLKDSAACVQAYKNWFNCENLILLGRVGHGATDKILVENGEIKYTYFDSLDITALDEKFIYFTLHFCQVHNSPLAPPHCRWRCPEIRWWRYRFDDRSL